jgi:methylenetetrahydrofolate reductase (NADPH)
MMRALRRRIELLYLEVFPFDGIEDQLLGMPDGAYIGITCSPSRGLDATLELVERLQGHDFHIVPHIAARQVRDAAHLRDIVQRLTEQGVESLFVPGGDIPEPVGEFDSALAMLRALAESGHPFKHIGVAAHPEGHPTIDSRMLLDALREKQAFATYFVTQMCFDADVLVRWIRMIRDAGIALPAWIGLPGVLNRTRLLRTSLRIGVGDSVRFARRQMKLAGKLVKSRNYRPDDLVFALEPHLGDETLKIDGFYLFSFNQVQETVAWRDEMLAGC